MGVSVMTEQMKVRIADTLFLAVLIAVPIVVGLQQKSWIAGIIFTITEVVGVLIFGSYYRTKDYLERRQMLFDTSKPIKHLSFSLEREPERKN